MKIDTTQAVSQVDAPRAVSPRAEPSKTLERATDQVAISKQASDLRHIAFAAAPELKGASAARIAEIRDAMKRGAFRADPAAIADKMLAEIEG